MQGAAECLPGLQCPKSVATCTASRQSQQPMTYFVLSSEACERAGCAGERGGGIAKWCVHPAWCVYPAGYIHPAQGGGRVPRRQQCLRDWLLPCDWRFSGNLRPSITSHGPFLTSHAIALVAAMMLLLTQCTS